MESEKENMEKILLDVFESYKIDLEYIADKESLKKIMVGSLKLLGTALNFGVDSDSSKIRSIYLVVRERMMQEGIGIKEYDKYFYSLILQNKPNIFRNN